MWKIWALSTWLDCLVGQVEDECLLTTPGREFKEMTAFETDVLIVGAGNA